MSFLKNEYWEDCKSSMHTAMQRTWPQEYITIYDSCPSAYKGFQ
jgi:hypothetical protein